MAVLKILAQNDLEREKRRNEQAGAGDLTP
jgi:hypothetical protein